MSRLVVITQAANVFPDTDNLPFDEWQRTLRTDDTIVLMNAGAHQLRFGLWTAAAAATTASSGGVAFGTSISVPLERTRSHTDNLRYFHELIAYCGALDIPLHLALPRSDAAFERYGFDRAVHSVDVYPVSVSTAYAFVHFVAPEERCCRVQFCLSGPEEDDVHTVSDRVRSYTTHPRRHLLLTTLHPLPPSQLSVWTFARRVMVRHTDPRLLPRAATSGTAHMYDLVAADLESASNIAFALRRVVSADEHRVVMSAPDRQFSEHVPRGPVSLDNTTWRYDACVRPPWQLAVIASVVLGTWSLLVPPAMYEIVQWLPELWWWTRFEVMEVIDAVVESIRRVESKRTEAAAARSTRSRRNK